MKSRWIAGVVITMLLLPMAACGTKDHAANTDITVQADAQKEEAVLQQSTDVTEAAEKQADETEISEEGGTETDPASYDGIDPEFKAAMDSYEAFFDEYIDFMKKYESASDDELIEMMAEYNRYLSQYIETTEKIEAIDEDELTSEELQYYLEVTTRINGKLAGIL